MKSMDDQGPVAGGRTNVWSEDGLTATAAAIVSLLAGQGATPRTDQIRALIAVLIHRQRVLVVQRTGFGKSVIYFAAARTLREFGSGVVLVICPLLALMRDQVNAATRADLASEMLNSSNAEDHEDIEARMIAGEVDIIFIGPERLADPRFVKDCLSKTKIGLLVVDEVHTLSEWGHDFRPDHQRIFRLLDDRPDLPVLATTATASQRVIDDLAEHLGSDTSIIRGSLARDSLNLAVIAGLAAAEQAALVDDILRASSGAGIVYTLTRKRGEQLAEFLKARGHSVEAYNGRMNEQRREELEDDLKANRLKALVATSALGMGFDKDDVAFVIHVGSPPSLISYYQQVGRAGRALDSAIGLLLPGATDGATWNHLALSTQPDEKVAKRVLHELGQSPFPRKTAELAKRVHLPIGALEPLLRLMAVDGAIERTVNGWRPTGKLWAHSPEKAAMREETRLLEGAAVHAYEAADRCLMSFLQEQLDDSTASECGHCATCLGRLPDGIPRRPSLEALHAARTFGTSGSTPQESDPAA